PEISFIMAHLGSFASGNYAEHLAAIDVAKRYPNVYLETSSVVFFEFLELAARELPPEKILFGSDGPLVDSRVELFKVRLLKLPKEHEAKVLSGNILRLLNLSSKPRLVLEPRKPLASRHFQEKPWRSFLSAQYRG